MTVLNKNRKSNPGVRLGTPPNLSFITIANRRTDWFWKLAHDLTDRFDVLCFETLSLKGMKRLWGRKVSDART